MAKKKQKEDTGLFKGVFMAYSILILHVVLVAAVGCLIFFFRGVTQYMTWIFAGCSCLVIFSAYYFFRRIRNEGNMLRETLNSPVFEGKAIEISFLGGFASVQIGDTGNTPPLIGGNSFEPSRQLEDPATVRVRELKTLAHLLEKDLITLDEYNQTKQQLFRNAG
ncbi:MAG: hypothetical protein B6245_15750 [Desulfobacteraceae bacterium 4572_88]|nr:MAG: hypothetical protein B6245_15750 [Desulfobacteraceae bacterium 4572_88]RLC20921.1 MAG: hypothetical protein DRI57_03635 [Deltaproteobacteria bacterium]